MSVQPSARVAGRSLPALLLTLFALLAAALPAPAAAQLIQEPQTKEEARQAAEAAREQASSSAGDGGPGTELALIGAAVVLLAGGAIYILRDAGASVGPDEARAAPRTPVRDDDVGRGAPREMFGGDVQHGGRVGRADKRRKAKRQRQARRANRPR